MTALILAMDKSMRSVDRFGRLYVEMSNISKATVNPYRGSEIPRNAELGLDPDRVYMLLRDPDELKKGAATFNNIPLLDRHIPVTAEAPSKQFVVGSTGTDARFDEPFLRNSLVVWDAVAIAGITTNQQRELSCAYSYDPDMTPGVYEGIPFDGKMLNIRGNHVALVEVGRAGPDVVVGDSKPSEKPKTMKRKLSANAARLHTALIGALLPVLAQDAQIGDLTAIAGSVKTLKGAKNQTTIVNAITTAYGDKLAADATLDHLPRVLEMIAADEDPELKPKVTDADDEDDEEDDKSKKKVDGAADDDDKDKIDKPAMDAAIDAAVKKAEAATVARMQAIHTAEREVEPHIGKLAVAQDSAENVYKLALDAAKVDTTGVHPSAFRAMVGMLSSVGATKPAATATNLAQDSANGVKSFAEMFPNASKMKGGA
jgi:hypothetical protein